MSPTKSGHLMHIVLRINRIENNKKSDISRVPNTGTSDNLKNAIFSKDFTINR